MFCVRVQLCKCGGGVNRLWALDVLCTGTLCKCGGGGVNRLWALVPESQRLGAKLGHDASSQQRALGIFRVEQRLRKHRLDRLTS